MKHTVSIYYLISLLLYILPLPSHAQEVLDTAIVQQIQESKIPTITTPQDSVAQPVSSASAPMQNAPVTQLAADTVSIGSQSNGFMKKMHKPKKNMISFNYNGQDLITVINDVAARKRVNFIFPQGDDAKQLQAAKLTLSFPEDITLDKAWQLLLTALDFAGFSIMTKGNMYLIVKNTDTTATEPAPLYIDVPPAELPDTQQRIRYIAYLANLKVSEETEGELQGIIKALLPESPKNAFVIDKRTNSILLMAKANEVKGVMEIISQLDKAGFNEKIEVVPLRSADAKTVEALLKNILKSSDQSINRYHLDARRQTEITYFSQFARAIAEPRRNALIIIGRNQAVDRIAQFVQEYIDIELETGKSILHVYKLQYLDANSFKDVLIKIVESKAEGGTGQSAAGGVGGGGAIRYFDEVRIDTDMPKNAGDISSAGAAATQDVTLAPAAPSSGSNSLIIAARNDDWQIIRKIIEELDTPLPQVLLEVFIADLTDVDLRKLGALTRNPAKIPLLGGMNVQAAMIQPGVMTNRGSSNADPSSTVPPLTIGVIEPECQPIVSADLLGPITLFNEQGLPIRNSNPAAVAQAGSTIISLNDNNGTTWSVLQLLKILDTSHIISHPHIITVNNKEAVVEIGEQKLLQGGLAGSGGSTLAAKQEYIAAKLSVKIKPRINLTEDVVNLAIMIASNDFTSANASDGTQNIRQVVTNANVKSEDMLALGGLMQNRNLYASKKTPILGDIPFIGNFFKDRSETASDSNLTIFIIPTIIKPRLRGGIGEITNKYLSIAKGYATQGDLFDNLRDPISRWFFKSGPNTAQHLINDFIDQDGEALNTLLYPEDRRNEAAIAAMAPGQLNQNVIKEIHDQSNPFRRGNRRARARLRS